ncbi:NnrU family protein [bacterium]|nr:NnrU family protein [bacterium]
MNATGIAAYATAWMVFAAMHSLLARSAAQQTVESAFRGWYRLIYNLVSLAIFAMVLIVGKEFLSNHSHPTLDSQAMILVLSAVRFGGIIMMALAFSTYDVGRFVGVTQIMQGENLGSAATEPFQRSGLNRWVRHPLYTGAFLVFWAGAGSSLGLWTAVWGSVYILIGSLFEERKLVRIYGADYRKYQQEVPRFVPRLR